MRFAAYSNSYSENNPCPTVNYLWFTRALSAFALWIVVIIAAGCGSEASLPPAISSPSTVTHAQAAAPTANPVLETTTPTPTAAPINDPTPWPSPTAALAQATRAATDRTPVPLNRTATPTATLQPTPTPTIIPPYFSGENALGYVRGLAIDIGSRPSNSPASQQAAQYVQRQLTSMGYSAALEPYSFSHFQDHRTELLLKQPELVELAARSFIYTKSGTAEGFIVYCGFGRPSDFPKPKLPGQIALIERGAGLTFDEKVANATMRDMAGVIVYNDRSGEFRGSLTRQATIPVVGVLQQDGKRLRDYLGKGPVVASLKVEAVTESFQGNNVVAMLRGTGGGKKVVVGAHYDSVSAGPGANDNGSGVGTLLELANSIRGRRYPFDIVFVAFGDEEIGLIGSKKYVESLNPQEKRQIVAMVNLDMVGVGDHMEIGGDKDLADRTLEIARFLGYEAREMTSRLGTSSDHASFLDARIPAVFIHRVDDPFYHTKHDTVDNIVARNLEAAGKTAYYLIEELARRN